MKAGPAAQLGGVLALVVCATGCGSDSPPTPVESALFTEITDEVGLKKTHGPWPDPSFAMPEIIGPGAALLDYDGDGDLDILQLRVPHPGLREDPAPNRLFRQDSDGTFAEVSATGIEDPGFAQAVAIGDVDSDGDLDVYFANYGEDGFYLNNGDGSFRDATREAGFSGESWSSGATFCDFDADGDLDLYVVGYLRWMTGPKCNGASGAPDYCSPKNFAGVPDQLYLNRGDGSFSAAAERLGIVYSEGGLRARGMSVLCTDFSGDGRLDFFVANDGEPNALWVQQDGIFHDEALLRGVAVNRYGRPEASMGLAVGDADGDGQLELFMTHLERENNTLYALIADGMYRDRTTAAEMVATDWDRTGFGTGFIDFDHDGDRDLAVVNGRVRRGSAREGSEWDTPWDVYAEPNFLFENDGTGQLSNVSDRAGAFGRHVEITRGLAFGDIDGDGDVDLLLSNVDNSLRLFRNDGPGSERHWLMVQPVSRHGVDALGARLTLVAGERRFTGWMLRGYSYQSSSDPRVHFGLGEVEAIDALEVTWPDGSRERFGVEEVDRVITVRQGEGDAL